MKSVRKLIPALALLLVSAVILSSASFAWFSMNTQVTATGMQVTAKSNNTFLLINTDTINTAELVQGAKVTTIPLTVADDDADVFPSKPKEASEIGALYAKTSDTTLTAGKTYYSDATGTVIPAATLNVDNIGTYYERTDKLFATGTPVTTAATAAAFANWYTAQNNNPGDSNDSVKNAIELSAFDDYVIKKTVYLTVAAGSDDAHNLTVTPTITAKTGAATDISAIKVLVVVKDAGGTIENMVTLDSGMTGTEKNIHTNDFSITDEGVATVDIYIYYDGNADAVYTNNIADLSGADITLAFDVEVE